MSTIEAASKYLNNLLLARGLLQHGRSINFAQTQESDGEETTTSRTINLIHELVLRRDRESEQNELLLGNIKNLRAAEAQRSLELQQAQDLNQQLRNEVTTIQAQHRSTNATVKKMENQVKELKEQNLKMKSLLDQVRAKCTSDVRKRDVEIDKLKGHLTGLQRGKLQAGGMKINVLNLQPVSSGQERRAGGDVNGAEWSLEKETNDFLAALVHETSAENVTLRQIVDNTLSTLKDITNYDDREDAEVQDGIGIPGQYRKSRQNGSQTLIPVGELSEQIKTVLQHCRTILKDPSFVPIEEVQVRDEEILKLRVGWDKMADRWKEAVTMMAQWRQHIAADGPEIDVGRLSDLSFGRSVAIRPDGQPVLDREDYLSFIFEESEIEAESTQILEKDETAAVESDLELETVHSVKRISSSPAKRGVRLERSAQPLREITQNSVVACTTESKITDGKESRTETVRKRKAPPVVDSIQRPSRRRNLTSP